MIGGIHGADIYSRGIMMVEITGMQHKGVNGNVHNHTGDRLHVTFRYQGPLLSYYS